MTNTINEDKSELLFNEGNQLLEEKNYEEAEKKFKEALVLVPNSSEILYNLALAYFEQQKYDLALEIVNKLKGIECEELIIELEKVGFKFTNQQKKRNDGFRIFIFIVIGLYYFSAIFAIISTPNNFQFILSCAISIGICLLWFRLSSTRKLRKFTLIIFGGILFLIGSYGAGEYLSDFITDFIISLFDGRTNWVLDRQDFLFIKIFNLFNFLIPLILSYFLCFGRTDIILNKMNYSAINSGIPVRWLNFYIYGRIPLGILFSISFLMEIIDHMTKINLPFLYLTIITVDIIFSIALFIGLHKRKLWSWKLNWFVLGLEVITRPLFQTTNFNEYVIISGILIVVWFLPNLVYFKKRKTLFS